MNRTIMYVLGILVCLLPQAVAQTSSNDHKPLSTWNISTADTGEVPAFLAVLTPVKPISIRRVEAISVRGPVLPTGNVGLNAAPREPVPCPLQYNLEVTNGLVAQTIPVSNVFVQKKSAQTYTDSGPVAWSFTANNRITVSLIPPKEQFPPVNCGLVGLRITIQYETAEDVAAKP
jgi:hypothetical protein